MTEEDWILEQSEENKTTEYLGILTEILQLLPKPKDNRGNKCRSWQIFVQALGRVSDCYYPIKKQREHSRILRTLSR